MYLWDNIGGYDIKTTEESTIVCVDGFSGSVKVEEYASREDAETGHAKWAEKAREKTLVVDTSGLKKLQKFDMQWFFDVAERARANPDKFRATQGKTVYGVPVEDTDEPEASEDWPEFKSVITEDDITNLVILLNTTKSAWEFEQAVA